MTPDEIDKLEAGRVIDVMVAENVMGWERREPDDGYLTEEMRKQNQEYSGRWHSECVWYLNGERMACKECGNMPEFSTDIAAAWQVVEKLSQNGTDFYLERDPQGKTHWARFNDTMQGTFNRDGCEDKRLGDANAPTAPLVICRAALKAVGAK